MRKVYSIYLLLTVNLVFYACRAVEPNPVAIRDFRNSLQPFLVKVVSTGIVVHDDATQYIEAQTTDKELAMLSRSEHPILRAIAFREMLKRQTFDHFHTIMDHLDDTAIVAVDAGEWGSWYGTVSDFMVENARWKTKKDRNKTIEAVITKHDYLRSAYYILPGIELKEAYYPFIREMAARDEVFYIRENALYALARFKKKQDIALIKEILLSNRGQLSGSCFALMQEYPDTTYLEVLEQYYPRRFYRSICDQHGYSEAAIAFIRAVASYKTDSTAKILNLILNRKPVTPCTADTFSLKDVLIRAVNDNPCAVYSKIRREISVDIENFKRRDSLDKLTSFVVPELPMDTAQEPIRW